MTGRTAGRRAIVVGGSLGGLSTANWLGASGFEVTVFERKSGELTDRGAGIVLHPSTVRYLAERTELEVTTLGCEVNTARYLSADGGLLSELPCRLRFVTYRELARHLTRSLSNTHIREGSAVVSTRFDPVRPSVTLADGTTHDADLVVFADGINSTGRGFIAAGRQPVWAGYVAWRGVVGADELSSDAEAVLAESLTYSLLADGHVLTYPILDVHSGRRLVNWLWYRNVSHVSLDRLRMDSRGRRHARSVPSGHVRPDALDELRAAARAATHKSVAEAVTATAEPFLQVVYDLESAHLVQGRTCILGDAAFVARPHAAAGTAKAAEDAWELAVHLERDEDVAEALAEWETAALARGRSLVERSRRAGTALQTGQWIVGTAPPFGLYVDGDSENWPVARGTGHMREDGMHAC